MTPSTTIISVGDDVTVDSVFRNDDYVRPSKTVNGIFDGVSVTQLLEQDRTVNKVLEVLRGGPSDRNPLHEVPSRLKYPFNSVLHPNVPHDKTYLREPLHNLRKSQSTPAYSSGIGLCPVFGGLKGNTYGVGNSAPALENDFFAAKSGLIENTSSLGLIISSGTIPSSGDYATSDSDIDTLARRESPGAPVFSVNSPHEPPFEPNQFDNVGKVRKSVIELASPFSFPADNFTNFMEERLMRWRPTESQNNIDSTLAGKHPFQSNELEKKSGGNLLREFSSWILRPKEVKLEPKVREGPSLQELVFFPKNDISLQPNTSESILPFEMQKVAKRFKSIEKQKKPLEQEEHVTEQPVGIPEPELTPRAVLFSEYNIDFDKRRDGTTSYPGNTFDSLDGSMREIVDDIGSVFSNCFSGTTTFFNNAFQNCS